MNKLYTLFCLTILGTRVAYGEVRVEESCWTHAARGGSDKRVQFVLKAYTDTDLDREVGAVVQYVGSKSTIPLVFKNFVRTDMEDDPDARNTSLPELK